MVGFVMEGHIFLITEHSMADNENQKEALLTESDNIQEQGEQNNMVSLQDALLTTSREITLQYSS